MSHSDYVRVQEPEPHLIRTRKILAAHPEVRMLFGNYPVTALWTALIVAVQFGVASWISLSHAPWWAVLVCAYTVGAVCAHALFVVIHDATHNLVFKGTAANRWAGMFANLPIVFPSAMGFRKFHLLHHRYQGELELDADLSGPGEAGFVGNSTILKALWLFFFWFVEGVVRPARLKRISVVDGWSLTNLAVQLVATGLLVWFTGWMSLAYLFLSLAFSIGLHPLGARWVQEHYLIPGQGNQETYSYYGPFNKLMFNVGYHNEHHDLMMVPWVRLPAVKRAAPEFYDSLYSHRSYTKLLLQFLFDRRMTLFSRVVRPDRVLTTDRQPVKLSSEHARIAGSAVPAVP